MNRSTGGVSPSVRPQSDRAADDLDGSDRPGTGPDATVAGSRADQGAPAPASAPASEDRPDPVRSRPYPDGAVAGLDAWNPALEHRNRRVALAPEPAGNAIPAQPRGSYASGPHPRPADGYGPGGGPGPRPAPRPTPRPEPTATPGSEGAVPRAAGPAPAAPGSTGGPTSGGPTSGAPMPVASTPRASTPGGGAPRDTAPDDRVPGHRGPVTPGPGNPGPGNPGSGDRTSRDREATAATGGRAARRARRAADEPADDSGAGWLQAEIARRVADRAGGTGRHARVDPSATPHRDLGQGDPDDAPAPHPDHDDPPRGAAARGVATGAGTAPPPAVPTTPPPAPSPHGATPHGATPHGVTPHGGYAPDDREPDDRVPDDRDPDAREPDGRPVHPTRARPARPRANLVPDPYVPEGVRPGPGWPPAPAATPAPDVADSGEQTPAPDVADSGKQWPPTGGGSGLPQRVPGATSWSSTWSPDRSALLAGTSDIANAADTASAPDTADATGTTGATDGATVADTDRDTDTADPRGTAGTGLLARPGSADERADGTEDAVGDTTVAAPADRSGPEGSTETRPVPTRWSAAGRRDPVAPTASRPDPADRFGPAADRGDHGTDYRTDDELDDDLPDEDELDDELDELRGGPLERTEVIWRAPEVDVAPAPEPSVEPGPQPFAPVAAAPYTGARPRPFSAEPTDPPAAAEEPGDDELGAGRVRIVLSERRSTAQSSRGLSDVQDPGAVGTLLRNSLVRTQLLLALRVSVVALIGLGVLPALFIAVPVLGQIEVLGIRLPWLLLGVLVYPFLLGLGWWYVSSAEAAEQDFADDVADR